LEERKGGIIRKNNMARIQRGAEEDAKKNSQVSEEESITMEGRT
jgi:hypothetical protein